MFIKYYRTISKIIDLYRKKYKLEKFEIFEIFKNLKYFLIITPLRVQPHQLTNPFILDSTI